jgi:hypothetical protein
MKIYETLILTVVLYGCGTWCLTLRKEHGLRVSENRELMWVYRPKREEDGSQRKLNNNKLHGVFSSPNNFMVI